MRLCVCVWVPIQQDWCPYRKREPGVMAHTCIPSPQEAKEGRLRDAWPMLLHRECLKGRRGWKRNTLATSLLRLPHSGRELVQGAQGLGSRRQKNLNETKFPRDTPWIHVYQEKSCKTLRHSDHFTVSQRNLAS